MRGSLTINTPALVIDPPYDPVITSWSISVALLVPSAQWARYSSTAQVSCMLLILALK